MYKLNSLNLFHITVGVVAFLARIGGFTGSPSEYTTIPFDVVDLNIGDAYDPVTGAFTAPVSGIYDISYEGLASSSCGTGNISLLLNVNGATSSMSCSEYLASGGTSVTIRLSAGDMVTVVMSFGSSCEITYPDSIANKFSGHLVYEII